MILTLGFVGLVSSAYANCGLEHCPMPDSSVKKASIGVSVALAETSEDSIFSGEMGLQGRIRIAKDWLVGGRVPVHAAVFDESTILGSGNGLLYVHWQTGTPKKGLALGTQIELPIASRSEMGESHWMALPYAQTWLALTVGTVPVETLLETGWAKSLERSDGHDHSHASSPQLNPHTGNEVQSRAEVRAVLPRTTGALTSVWVGAQLGSIVEVDTAQLLLSTGAVVGFKTARHSVQSSLMLPVGEYRRHNYRWQIQVQQYF